MNHEDRASLAIEVTGIVAARPAYLPLPGGGEVDISEFLLDACSAILRPEKLGDTSDRVEELAISLLLANPYICMERERSDGSGQYEILPDPESSARVAFETAETFTRLAAERRTT